MFVPCSVTLDVEARSAGGTVDDISARRSAAWRVDDIAVSATSAFITAATSTITDQHARSDRSHRTSVNHSSSSSSSSRVGLQRQSTQSTRVQLPTSRTVGRRYRRPVQRLRLLDSAARHRRDQRTHARSVHFCTMHSISKQSYFVIFVILS